MARVKVCLSSVFQNGGVPTKNSFTDKWVILIRALEQHQVSMLLPGKAEP